MQVFENGVAENYVEALAREGQGVCIPQKVGILGVDVDAEIAVSAVLGNCPLVSGSTAQIEEVAFSIPCGQEGREELARITNCGGP